MVTARVSDPPAPRAVSVYVAVLLGKTCRLPLAGTVPRFWSMEISVALATDQRKVAD